MRLDAAKSDLNARLDATKSNLDTRLAAMDGNMNTHLRLMNEKIDLVRRELLAEIKLAAALAAAQSVSPLIK